MDNLRISTPEGTASYPHLNTPDAKFGKENYNVKLRLPADDPETLAFLAKVGKYAEKGRKHLLEQETEVLGTLNGSSSNPKTQKAYKAQEALVEILSDIHTFKVPYSDEFDPETDEPTGNILVAVKSNASFKSRKTGEVISLAPKFYDSAAQMIQESAKPQIKGGSRICLNITLVPYAMATTANAGLSARINGVQVIKLSGGGGDSGDSGFGAKEGGYSQEEVSGGFKPSSTEDADMDY